ncbi:hypothetical protein [Desulfoluna spongiiphila]|uniref:Lipoprotein n=1 Tax=Desulfoluna spongiiphila TaxID=419481 RepID=A0A1G5C774_9BACT|nr:hypothetical protein [Desulfoluna spongiiphila]SCX98283.1 hypothetical protein SAMN05216233_102426 [Desulfoluna spongiiphila]VVS94162.1 consensus disorder prediction [Desulfoluna spongiiphila]
MKFALRCVAVVGLMGFMCACATSESTGDNVLRGMYESSRQMQEMDQRHDPSPGQDLPTYEQYNREWHEP